MRRHYVPASLAVAATRSRPPWFVRLLRLMTTRSRRPQYHLPGRMHKPRSNWSRPLPRPIIIPEIMTLTTLADVRTLIQKHLPKDRRERSTWRHVAVQLARPQPVPTRLTSQLRCAWCWQSKASNAERRDCAPPLSTALVVQ